MIVTIHQPEHLPYYGLFRKILQSDLLIILDDVQYEKNGWQNRNRIIGTNQPHYITVPVKHTHGTSIMDVEINQTIWEKARTKALKSISQAYSKHPYYSNIFERLSKIYSMKFSRLADLNMVLLLFILDYLEIPTRIQFSSLLNVPGKSTQKLVNLCRAAGADTYISGPGGKDYLDESLFEDIEVRYCNNGIRYPQKNPGFVPNLSVIDGIFNHGTNFKNYLDG